LLVEFIDWSEIARAPAAFQAGNGAPGAPFDEFRGNYFGLPYWFDLRADPWSNAYQSQQDRLSQMMVGDGATYDPVGDKILTVGDAWIDSVVRPDIWAPE
jgi:hypothetical protein